MLVNNPLYNLKSKKKLADLLFYNKIGFQIEELSFINNYSVFVIESTQGEKVKKRIVETPRGMLKVTHDRIFKFLNRVNLPDYLISKKGSSYINNHLKHRENSNIYTIDIQKFYPMCSFYMVYNYFITHMKMSPDVAYIVSKILTIDYDKITSNEKVMSYFKDQEEINHIILPTKHIPTGSSVSTLLSFLSYREMFDEIYDFAKLHNIEMTVYVDDITFSTDSRFPRAFVSNVKSIITKYGHDYNRKKSKKLTRDKNKNITGVIVSKSKETKIPNKLHFKYKIAKRDLIKNPSKINEQRLNGIKEAMNQINRAAKK